MDLLAVKMKGDKWLGAQSIQYLPVQILLKTQDSYVCSPYELLRMLVIILPMAVTTVKIIQYL